MGVTLHEEVDETEVRIDVLVGDSVRRAVIPRTDIVWAQGRELGPAEALDVVVDRYAAVSAAMSDATQAARDNQAPYLLVDWKKVLSD